jgi:hypothetical protein
MRRRPFSATRAPNATRAPAAAIAVAAVLASGCSFLFSEGAPDDYRARASFQCGDSYAPPLIDSAATGLFALVAVSAAANEDARIGKAMPADQSAARYDARVSIGLGAAIATATAASALYGYHAAGDCRRARSVHLADVARARVLPPPYGVPPAGEPPLSWPPLPAAPTPAAPPTPSP